MWAGAHAYLTDPSHMYEQAANYLARLHIIAPPGGLDAFVSPPPLAVLAIPVALLPQAVAVQLWTAVDAAALLLALLLLDRVVARHHRLARPIFWLVAGYFPPLFADISAGSAAASCCWARSRRSRSRRLGPPSRVWRAAWSPP